MRANVFNAVPVKPAVLSACRFVITCKEPQISSDTDDAHKEMEKH